MHAIILAAGRGNVLSTLTNDKPKCMIDIGGETIIGRQIRLLNECGIQKKDITLVIGYKYETVTVPNDIRKIINSEYKSTGNTYSLLLALENISDDCIILDGDLIFHKPALVKALTRTGNVLLTLKKETGYAKTGLEFCEDYIISDIGKHISSGLTYANIMKIERNTLALFREVLSAGDARKRWYTIPLSRILDRVKFTAVDAGNDFYEINTYSDYLTVRDIFLKDVSLIMVTGANGFLGNKIYHILKRDYNVIGICGHAGGKYDAVDLSDYDILSAYVASKKPGIIINTAGIAEPEACERDKYKTQKINIWAVDNLVKVCRLHNIKLIHISTDYVFDGEKEEDYYKFDVRKPKNFYGETKMMAEDIVNSYPNSLIVRIPVIYGFNDENDKETFPAKVIRTLSNNGTINADDVQIRYPVLIDEVAFSIGKALHRTGIIHITSSQGVSKYEWAQTIAKVFSLNAAKIHRCKQKSENRPLHVHLHVSDADFVVSDIEEGTKIMKKQMNCVFKLIYKSLPYQNIYGRNIGVYRFELGRKLAACIPQNIMKSLDSIVPVPSSGIYYAMGLSCASKIPFVEALVKPDVQTRSFQIADVGTREKMIHDKIYPIKDFLKGKRVALVDEAIFTGTTLRVVCDMVWACGVKEIFICIPTPVCKNICDQYIQPERRMLCEDKEIDLSEYFHVNAVFFQKYENFVESIEDDPDMCYECFQKYISGGK